MKRRKYYHHPELACCVSAFAYDFRNKYGILRMAPMNCCDMGGCIAFFVRIDPTVVLIDTFAGAEKDTAYIRRRSTWYALTPEGVVVDQNA